MSSQANDVIRLGVVIIPILVLLIAGQALRFDPNRRVNRISVTREAVHPFEQPWGYFVGAINRVGQEKPWSIGEFYGKSYFCDPRGKIVAQASRD